MRARKRDLIVALLAGIVIGTAMVGTGLAITSPGFTYSTPKTGRWAMPGADFSAAEGENSTFFHGEHSSQPGGAGECLVAAAHFPQGARLKAIKATFFDGSSTYLNLTMYREGAGGATAGTSFDLTAPESTEATSSQNIAASFPEPVNNAQDVYPVWVCEQLDPGDPGPGARDSFLVGVWISYTYTKAGD